MGSMSDSDRKRRHFSSLSPTPVAATAKKLPFLPVSEDKKLDIVVLQYQNQKLIQKLETQKLEYAALENRFTQLKERQKSFDPTLAVVKKSWEQLVNDLESCSEHMRESSGKSNFRFESIIEDGCPSTVQDVFLSRLMQSGATECATTYKFANQTEENRKIITEKAKSILKNMATAVNNLWVLMDGLHTALLKKLPVDVLCRQKLSSDLDVKVKNLRLEFSELHLKHKSLSSEFQIQRDLDAKNKADLERLKGELASAVAELEESNHKLATLKAERDAAKGAILPVLNVGSTHIPSDKIRDKQKDLQDMESTLKELLDQGSNRLMELKSLHEERIRILQQLCDIQNTLKNLKCITSSHAFQLVKDQIEKSKSDVLEYKALYEKLQVVEKDTLTWREREWYIKNDLADIFQRSVAVSDFRVADLRSEIQKKIEERNMIENKLKEEAREPGPDPPSPYCIRHAILSLCGFIMCDTFALASGRKQIIAEFKSLVSSFPEEMGSMQSQLRKYKESASDIHSLRADVQSISSILDRKVKECDAFSAQSADQLAEIKRLLGVFQGLKESEMDLKLMLEMFRRESIDSRTSSSVTSDLPCLDVDYDVIKEYQYQHTKEWSQALRDEGRGTKSNGRVAPTDQEPTTRMKGEIASTKSWRKLRIESHTRYCREVEVVMCDGIILVEKNNATWKGKLLKNEWGERMNKWKVGPSSWGSCPGRIKTYVTKPKTHMESEIENKPNVGDVDKCWGHGHVCKLKHFTLELVEEGDKGSGEEKVEEEMKQEVGNGDQVVQKGHCHALKLQVQGIEFEQHFSLDDLMRLYDPLVSHIGLFNYDGDVMDAREAEYRAWARVQSLKSSLDEHNLEFRVKTANEAEARSQQKLAAGEAEIADMRQKLEDSKRQMCDLSDVLKSKNKQNENYLSEIESIGQAYDDMQTQNQHLLQQITERDDYNIKLVLEGVRARQKQDSLLMDKRVIEQEIQQTNTSLNLYDMKSARIEDQLKFCSDQLQRLAEDKLQSSVASENTQRRLSDIGRQTQQIRDTVMDMQSKIGSNRVTRMELQVELEKERFTKKRLEEDLEVARRQFSRLKEHNEGSSVTEKLQQELEEYRDIIKCSICHDRAKEMWVSQNNASVEMHFLRKCAIIDFLLSFSIGSTTVCPCKHAIISYPMCCCMATRRVDIFSFLLGKCEIYLD
ncbi:unnamed protein product [Sphenostylis stenocarpa]|uniref:E3 ubiquitin protein ligase n=1 Tax=Sphenostylis stenocarpa TaxID=92480 RepID=A0AA86V7Z3_9FABA|nr:unnamed protein product [Sphenostylis stenocarpa]